MRLPQVVGIEWMLDILPSLILLVLALLFRQCFLLGVGQLDQVRALQAEALSVHNVLVRS